MSINLDALTATFREEAFERLTELEETLLELERAPTDASLVASAFRALHTIKGSGAMFGFEDIASFTHEIETVFDEVRSGRLTVTPELIALSLRCKDFIRKMVDGGDAAADATARAGAVTELRALAGSSVASAPLVAPAPTSQGSAVTRTFRIRFRPAKDLLLDGTNPLHLLSELSSLGDCSVVADIRRVPPLESFEPEACYVSWELVLSTDKDENAIKDVFVFIEGRADIDITTLERPKAFAASKVATAPRDAPATNSSIRVPTTKLDALVDLVGELVIARARLSQIAQGREDRELNDIAEVVERLASELRDQTLNIRMVPIGTTFSRFNRLVHDLSSELGKDINLVTEGAETELDKTVIERLGDPLVHLIRNCCDHGIEPGDERQRAGKPSQGTVFLSAYHSGASVLVEVRDDGGGLDQAGIRARAVERGLIDANAKLGTKELFNLVFLPGFSTAKRLSNLSGRGVGLDVVKRSIEALRGSIDVESEPGRGTTIRLKLPLTLAIIDGLLVSVGDARYVLPLSAVEECIELTKADVDRANGNQFASVRGALVPYVRLRDWFGAEGARPDIEQVVIAHIDGNRLGLVVDQVVGQHQTVIKGLGSMYKDVRGLSGATILGDGSVALIVDVGALTGTLDVKLNGGGAEHRRSAAE